MIKRFTYMLLLVVILLSGCQYYKNDNIKKVSSYLVDAYFYMCEKYPSNNCVKAGSDFSYIKVDTNPNEYKTYDCEFELNIVRKFNEYFDLPESVYQKIILSNKIGEEYTIVLNKLSLNWYVYSKNRIIVLYILNT